MASSMASNTPLLPTPRWWRWQASATNDEHPSKEREPSMTITWTHFPAGEQGFYRAPVLLKGRTEAILIDGGFTLSDGRKLAAAIQATGKRLTTVYVSQSDPDYYFSLT